jgi:ketosteroid isomerase-like protein
MLTHWFHEAKPKSEAHATEGRQEGIMKMLIGSLTLVLLLGTVPVVWAQADPAKEVADIGLKRGQAGARGDVDGVLADVADNVVITSARSGFRMEGKEAYRTFLTNLYQNYPTRQGLTRQVTRRVFQEGNVVVVNGYNDQTFIDKNGKPSVLMIRTSQTWVKTGGRWLLVDQHTSGMPGTP